MVEPVRADVGKALGFRWGGDFHAIKDRPQFQWSGELTLGWLRRRTVGYVFGSIKDWMGRCHCKTRSLKIVANEASLHFLAYSLKLAIALLGTQKLMAAMQARASTR